MKKIGDLVIYSYPVILNSFRLKENALTINKILKKEYKGSLQFLGTGSSGAMIMAALAVNSDYKNFGIVEKRKNESSHRSRISDFNDEYPAVVVDDQISSGRTMKRISRKLPKALKEKVEVVAANNADAHECMLKQLFPNLKLIIY